MVDQQTLDETRKPLHGLAEMVLAGPQHRRGGDIRLQVCPGGFGTTREPELRVDGMHLVTDARHVPVADRTFASLAELAGVEACLLTDVYEHGPGLSVDDVVRVDPEAVQVVLSGLAMGNAALRRFAPDVAPSLWSEHFGVRTSVDDVHYGVCVGDNYIAEPYAYIYVAPEIEQDAEVWNAPFGAARRLSELGSVDAVHAMYTAGRAARA